MCNNGTHIFDIFAINHDQSLPGHWMCFWQTENMVWSIVDINLNDLPLIIYARFVLHNYCEANRDMIDYSH